MASHWEPFAEIAWRPPNEGQAGRHWFSPAIDIVEDEDAFVLNIELPGMRPGDVTVSFDDHVLTIRGERKSESERNEQNFHVMERSHGRFQRSIQLPFSPNPDEVRAEVRHGVLEVRIPKHAAQERSRRIQVRGDDTQTTTGGAAMTQAVGGGAASGSERAKSDAGSAGATTAGGGASPSSGQGASSSPSATTSSGR